jgi:hypothetical protein
MEYLPVPILRLDVVGESLDLLVRGVVVVVVLVCGEICKEPKNNSEKKKKMEDKERYDIREGNLRAWGSSSGPTYSSLTTLPHSPQRSMGRSRDTYDEKPNMP